MGNGTPEDNAFLMGRIQQQLENIHENTTEIKKSMEGFKNWNIRQDEDLDGIKETAAEKDKNDESRLSKIETNQKWAFKILGLLQIGAVGLFGWLWKK